MDFWIFLALFCHTCKTYGYGLLSCNDPKKYNYLKIPF